MFIILSLLFLPLFVGAHSDTNVFKCQDIKCTSPCSKKSLEIERAYRNASPFLGYLSSSTYNTSENLFFINPHYRERMIATFSDLAHRKELDKGVALWALRDMLSQFPPHLIEMYIYNKYSDLDNDDFKETLQKTNRHLAKKIYKEIIAYRAEHLESVNDENGGNRADNDKVDSENAASKGEKTESKLNLRKGA